MVKKEKVFEDEFMDVQSGLISLCLELIDNKADKVYVYCSVEEKTQAFNACFKIGNEIVELDKTGIPTRELFSFLKTGSHDLFVLRDVCAKYNRPVPTEIKLCYDVNTGNFNSDYRYDEICSANTNTTASDVFCRWVEDLKCENTPI